MNAALLSSSCSLTPFVLHMSDGTSGVNCFPVWVAVILCIGAGRPIGQEPIASDEEASFVRAIERLQHISRSEKAQTLTGWIKLCETLIPNQPAETQRTAKVSPPRVLVGGDHGWSPGSENDLALARIFPGSAQQRTDGKRAVICWNLMLFHTPIEALQLMIPRLGSQVPNTVDVIRLLAACERQPGRPLQVQIPKSLWRRFHESENVCYKVLALEKYDSTEQSSDELLKLYRECLFDSFGYLQVRALEGIYRNKDYRAPVRELLEEYLGAKPPSDDGTLPAFPWVIRDPVAGAQFILAEMEKVKATNGSARKGVSDARLVVEATGAANSSHETKRDGSKKPIISATASSEAPNSATPWFVAAVVIVAAIFLLWWRLKVRK